MSTADFQEKIANTLFQSQDLEISSGYLSADRLASLSVNTLQITICKYHLMVKTQKNV
jgi:hypothetical protein